MAGPWDDLDRFSPRTPRALPDPAAKPFGPLPRDPRAFRPMTAEQHVQLSGAPRTRRDGTEVRLKSYDIPSEKLRSLIGVGLPEAVTAITPDHMYVEYDDGAERLIGRGGPSAGGLGFARGKLDGSLGITADVAPARGNVDDGKGVVVASTYLPGVTAEQAATRGRLVARDLAMTPRRYGAGSNSNTYAAEVGDPLFPGRPRHPDAWGGSLPLRDAPRVLR